ncbi:MAG: hypothetical protein JW893_07715 [Candidatus Omnitrophica bacterium]|nr:hypothetical protein [Candidatus Omnitrophota bacterium]
MKKLFPLFLVVLALLMAPIAFAGDVWEMAESDQYGTKLGGMLGRGGINIATCFVDVIVHTVEGTQEGPAFVGTLGGLGSGIACTALRVTSGALDVVTSWVPGFNGFPVSKSYSDCLDFGGTSSYSSSTSGYSAPAYSSSSTSTYAAPAQSSSSKTKAVEEHDPMKYVKK